MSMQVHEQPLVSGLPQSVTRPRDVQQQEISVNTSAQKREVSDQLDKTPQREKKEVDEQALKQFGKLNEQLKSSALKFEVVRELDTTVIKVIDTTKNEVIRQIPSEEALARLKDIKQYLDQRLYTDKGEDKPVADALSHLLYSNRS